ncbi:hypothetical protein FIBSPDRAFT_765778 [Athelia psychrophila]|uniref:Uncharacterized protein n=1 Tax=Athelia psychrophila TaxID=1759441 RepID=A0A167VXJ4_9AGAM|nr:hypothetical protein FIBSPDRAFT_765778 [Fibularhizoctonia sp. CBS 109695]
MGPFDPSDPSCIRSIEESTELNPFSMGSMTWCRPAEKCATNQSFATATINVTNANDRNHLLQGQAYIQDKLITIQKDKHQPTL